VCVKTGGTYYIVTFVRKGLMYTFCGCSCLREVMRREVIRHLNAMDAGGLEGKLPHFSEALRVVVHNGATRLSFI
jgi:hypothetical protein